MHCFVRGRFCGQPINVVDRYTIMKKLLLCLAAFLLLTLPCISQWGAGGCFIPRGPVGPSVFSVPFVPAVYAQPVQPASQYQWSKSTAGDGWWLLKYGSQWKGAYHPEHGYKPMLKYPDQWGDITTAPTALPEPMKASIVKTPPPDKWVTEGVDTSKISDTPKFTFKGMPVEHEQVMDLLQEPVAFGQLSDDTMKPAIAIIGDKGDRQKVLDAINGNAALKEALKNWKVQFYAPEHHHLRDWKIKKTGKPWIVFLRPDKQDPKKADVVHQVIEFTGAEQLLVEVQLANNKLDPNHTPAPLPAPQPTPILPSLPNIDLNNPIWLLAIGAAVYFLFFRRNNQNAA